MSTAGLKSAGLPPLYQRIGFPFIFLGAGYVLSTGDKRNGSGIATGTLAPYMFSLWGLLIRPRSLVCNVPILERP